MKLQTRAVLYSILDFFGSMSFAITLLISVSIVSLIGALIAQGEPAAFYREEFGPFWAALFETLSVNDIFNSSGFFILVALLFVSIAICIWRRAPGILQEFNQTAQFKPDAKAEYIQQSSWESSQPATATVSTIAAHLQDNQYRYSIREQADHTLLTARKGGLQRLGYLLVHFGVLIIILGALLDANMPLRIQLDMDTIQPVADPGKLEQASLLGIDSGSFRGIMNLGIGETRNDVILTTDEGFLRRELPFAIALQDFHIDHYANGSVKSFSSVIQVRYRDSDKVEEFTVPVEKGIDIAGYRIYQRGFEDAGSGMKLQLWDFTSNDAQAMTMDFKLPFVMEKDQSKLPVDIEFVDFKKDNSNPLIEHTLQQEFESVGPALFATLTNTQGLTMEAVFYLNPIKMGKKQYHLLGVREEFDNAYRYSYIPVDRRGELQRLIKLNALLNDKGKTRQIIRTTARVILKDLEIDSRVIRNEWIADMEKMLQLFLEGGSQAVLLAYQPGKPTNRLDEINAANLQRLQSLIEVFYTYVVDEDKDLTKGRERLNQRQMRDFDEIFTTLDWFKSNHVPVLFTVSNYKHHQGSVLEISYLRGYYPVLGGMLMLLLGILMMFYIHHRRLEILVTDENGSSKVSFIGSSRKSPVTLKNEYDRLLRLLKSN